MRRGLFLALVALSADCSRAITWNPAMTDPAPNTNRNVSTVSANLAAQARFNGTGIISQGGTGCLISDQWVLTARHVVAGATNGTFYLEGTNVAFTNVHTRADSDVALVKLSSPVTNYPAVAPYQDANEAGKDVWIVGYGQHGQFTGTASQLSPGFTGRYAAMNRVGYSTNLGGTIGICLQFSYDGTNAGSLPYEGATAPGDSGGPMFMEENGRLWVVGETFGVAPPAPGFYHGRVGAYKDWIRATTGINFNEANWDADPATPGIQNGAGTWGGVGSNWFFGRTNFPWAGGYDVVFGAGTNAVGVVTLATNTSAGSITFVSNAATQLLTGAGFLSLSGGVISNSSAVVISAPMSGTAFTKSGAGALTLSNAGYSGNLVFSGPVVVDESTNRTWSGFLSGGNNWFKSGAGTLTLAGSNAFTGFLTVSNGAVRATHSAALGSATGSVVNGGNALAALEFAGNVTVADQIQLVMHNTPGHTQIRNISGTNKLTGNLLLNSGGGRWDVGSAAGRIIFQGAISNIANSTNTWRTLFLHGPGAGVFSGPMVDSSNGVDKLGVSVLSGDWTLGGSNKSYSGMTSIGPGAILRLQASLASPLAVQGGAVLATTLTNWTNFSSVPTVAALTAGNGTAWKVRLETPSLENFSETTNTIPVLTATGGLSNINPASITVETPAFPGSGTWGAVTNGNTLSVSYTPDGYAAWVAGFTWGANSSAPGDNPDGDSLDNFEEYALGGNPLDAASDPVPVGGTTSDGRFLTLTFRRERSDVTYAVQACDQIVSGWSNAVVNPESIGADVSYTDTVEISSQDSRFLRLHLTR